MIPDEASARTELIAFLTANIGNDLGMDDTLRLQTFPGLGDVYGYLEMFGHFYAMAVEVVDQLVARHGTLAAFWQVWYDGTEYHSPGVFAYDMVDALLTVLKEHPVTSLDIPSYTVIVQDALAALRQTPRDKGTLDAQIRSIFCLDT